MENENVILENVIKPLYLKLKSEDFVTDKFGGKIVELIGSNFKLNPTQKELDLKVRKTNKTYAKKELEWYDSQNLSVKDIGKVAKIWNSCADDNGIINSNYGWCIYSKDNYSQYDNCLKELLHNKESRRACMIYNRPSMHYDAIENNRNDFMCTFSVQTFVRNNKLDYITIMRSNDVIYGFLNDFYWHCVVYERLFNDLKKTYSNLEIGTMYWQASSLHIYERHFNVLEQIYKEWFSE